MSPSIFECTGYTIEWGLSLEDLENRKNVEVYYIHGPSGVGKSHLARKLLQEYMREHSVSSCDIVEYKNEFWNGVVNNEVCWYDDFRDSDMKPREFIKFVDYMPQRMNYKGGYTLNRYKFIVITSVQKPNELYRNVSDEPRKQWERRIRFIDMRDPYVLRCCSGFIDISNFNISD